MKLVFEDPAKLWLACLIIVFVISGTLLFNVFTTLKRRVSVFIRCVLIALIVLALAQLALTVESRKIAVVAVVDTSASVRSLAAEQFVGLTSDRTRRVPAAFAAEAFLRESISSPGPEDLVGVVTFDSEARVERMPMPGPLPELSKSSTDGAGTNIAKALKLASAIIPPDASGRIVLISDGNETSGDARALAKELFLDGRPLPIDVVPIRYEFEREIIVTSLDAPPSAPEGGVIPLRVVIESPSVARGTLRVTDEGTPLEIGESGDTARVVELVPGTNVIRIEAKVMQGRIHRFEAVFEPEVDAEGRMIADTRTENNKSQGFTLTPGAGATLVVRSIDAPSGMTPLERVLDDAKIAARVISAGELPSSILEYRNYDAVIFDGVPAHEVSDDAQQLLNLFVRDMGGGFVMIGGRNSFAAGGWRGSALEDILPVELEVPDRIVTPETATVFVLDNSGSMNHAVAGSRLTQQQIANEAVALAIRSLSAKDKIGVVVFNSDASELISLQLNGDGTSHAQNVRGITSDGGTNMGAGLEVARRMLEESKSAVRHIVVMTDGQSMNSEALPSLAKAIADRGVRITTIGVGDGADARGLDQVAKAGGGTYYQVRDPKVLPRIFLKAVNIERQPLVREGDFTPKVSTAGSPMVLGVQPPESLGGISLTQRRKEPNVVNALVTPEGDPLLSHWNVGLGQVVAFTSDADRWAEKWKTSESYSSFWTGMIRTISRADSDGRLEADATVRAGVLEVTVAAADLKGDSQDGLDVEAVVVGSDGSRREVKLNQSGPGEYQATIREPAPGANIVLVRSSDGGAAVTGATVTSGAEFRDVMDRASTLESIAQSTGGRVIEMKNAGSARFFDRSQSIVRRTSMPVSDPLLLWIAILTLIDLAVRRVAWDRWIGARAFVPARSVNAEMTAELRARRDTFEPAEVDQSIAFGEADAARLAAKARDERRARRLGQVASTQHNTTSEDAIQTQETPESQSGLFAAKKRARERFDGDDEQVG